MGKQLLARSSKLLGVDPLKKQYVGSKDTQDRYFCRSCRKCRKQNQNRNVKNNSHNLVVIYNIHETFYVSLAVFLRNKGPMTSIPLS